MKKLRSILLSFIIITIINSMGSYVLANDGFKGTFRQSFATVIFSGLGGAVLGLSTLSFYGDPQEHINNIWIGLALGIIGGSAYVVQKAAGSNEISTKSLFNPYPQAHQIKRDSLPILSYRFEF